MSTARKRFAAILVFYLAWLGVLGGLGAWAGRPPEVKLQAAPDGEAR